MSDIINQDVNLTDEQIDRELSKIYKKMNDKRKLYIRNYLSTNNKSSAAKEAGFTGASIESYIYYIDNFSITVSLQTNSIYTICYS